jgi:adenylate cyclase
VKLSFRFKLTLLACVVAIVPLVTVGWIVNDINREALQDTNRQLLDSVISNLATSLETTVAEGDRALVASASALDRKPEERDAIVEAALDTQSVIKQLAIYDATGTKVVELENALAFKPPPLPARFAGTTTPDGAVRFGEVAFAERQGYVHRFVTTRDNQFTVAAYVSLAPVARRGIDLGVAHVPTGQLAMATTDRRIVVDSLGERIGNQIDANSFGVLVGAEQALASKHVYVINDADRADGTRVTGAVRRVGDTPFVVMVERPYREVYRSIATVQRIVFGSIVAAIVIAAAAGILLARRMTRPIAALVDYAGELAKRHFDRKVTVRSTDELGVLGNALENAATELAESDRTIRKEQAIRNDLGRYLPNKLVDQIVARERSLALGGERREISVVFADVVGFTPLAEREAAETVVTLLNELFSILTEIVFRHGGTVDKFVGDCVMAVWGATEDQPDHPRRAIAAARDMQRWLEVANELWQAQHNITIELAIGVHTGDAVVGNFGSESRMEFTAIGDVVNVAARLEAIARPNQILSTIATRARLANDPEFVSLGVRPLIGKSQPIELFEVRS